MNKRGVQLLLSVKYLRGGLGLDAHSTMRIVEETNAQQERVINRA